MGMVGAPAPLPHIGLLLGAQIVAPSGGFFIDYERYSSRRKREQTERRQAEDDAKAIQDALDREIAALLHAQEGKDAERAELIRLDSLIQRLDAEEARSLFNERVTKAYARALAQQNVSALLAFDRELQRQLEDEEFAVVMALALDD